MTGSELLRKIKKLGDRKGVKMELNHRRGKGGHITIYFGDKFTIIPNLKNELKPGTYKAILKQLGIDERELR